MLFHVLILCLAFQNCNSRKNIHEFPVLSRLERAALNNIQRYTRFGDEGFLTDDARLAALMFGSGMVGNFHAPKIFRRSQTKILRNEDLDDLLVSALKSALNV